MSEFKEWKDASTPERQTARVCLDRKARSGLFAVLEEIGQASDSRLLDRPDDFEELAEKAKELEAQVEASTKVLTFEKVPRREWLELEEAHPATPAQRETNPKQQLDPDGLEIAAVAATSVDPVLDEDDAEWLRDFLPTVEWNAIVTAVWAANHTGAVVPKDVSGIADQLITELRSITRRATASPSPSSEGE